MLIEAFSNPLAANNPNGVNPALLTYDEYERLVDPKNKSHPETAYDWSIDRMQSRTKEDYPTFVRRVKLSGMIFEFRLKDDKQFGRSIAVFDEDDMRCGIIEDEWGSVLVSVAREYRDIGLGSILHSMARQMEPIKPSGGFTPDGRHSFRKVHRTMVRKAMADGLYNRLVRAGKITVERAREIINSARPTEWEKRRKDSTPKRTRIANLSTRDSNKWLLYVGEYGDFILYDRKLRDLWDSEEDDFYTEKAMKGFAFLGGGYTRDNRAYLHQFGGDSAAIKRLMMNCVIEYARREKFSMYIDPDDAAWVSPKHGRVTGETFGKWAAVEPIGDGWSYDGLGKVEAIWRKKFDRYDEFQQRLIELAHHKFEK